MPVKVSHAVIYKVLTKFGYDQNDISIQPTQSGYRNLVVPIKTKATKPKKLALIFYKREPKVLEKIKLANLISNQLANIGWPTRQTISKNHQNILRLKNNKQSIYCCLYNYLNGHTIEWENYTKKHIKLLGQVLGYLHQDLAKIRTNSKIIANKECSNLRLKLLEMNTYFNNKKIQHAIEQKLKLKMNNSSFDRFSRLIKRLDLQKESQILHLDFVRGNVLFDNLSNCHFDQRFVLKLKKKSTTKKTLAITGVLDFEKAALGLPELDISRTLAFLLVDCKNKTPDKIFQHFLNSGYIKRAGNTKPNQALIKELIFMYLLIDFYHFLKHNPYEYLNQNQHFLRTRNYLLRYGNQQLLLST